MSMKYKAALGKIKAVSEDADNVFIEGYANMSRPDESFERLDPESMDDSRYIDNPILLFNHNKEYVVGKTLSWLKKPDGVYVKCAISKSAHPDISYVRDLVQEGILKAFSVGFSGGDSEKDPQYPGTFLTKNWKLHELSIVPIPMQANSLFSVTKAFGENLRNCKSLGEARIMTLTLKGANVAALIAAKLEGLEPEAKQETVAKIVESSGANAEQVNAIISGETVEVQEQLLQSLSSVLSISMDELKAANEKDSSQVPPEAPAEEKAPEAPAEPEAPVAPATKPDASIAETPAEQVRKCVVGKIPELIKAGHSQQDAAAMAVAECSKEKAFAPSDLTDVDWECFLTPAPAIEAEHTKSVIDTGDNLHIQLMQQNVQMLGSIATKMDSVIQLLTSYMALENTTSEVPEAEQVSTIQQQENSIKAMIKEARELNARLKSYE